VKTYRVDELEGALLDAAVARCFGQPASAAYVAGMQDLYGKNWPMVGFAPSSEWDHGGPIIERERIAIAWTLSDWSASHWQDAAHFRGHIMTRGATPLVAAMRAYVVSKFGEEVDLASEATR
jgi:hypothetical protein